MFSGDRRRGKAPSSAMRSKAKPRTRIDRGPDFGFLDLSCSSLSFLGPDARFLRRTSDNFQTYPNRCLVARQPGTPIEISVSKPYPARPFEPGAICPQPTTSERAHNVRRKNQRAADAPSYPTL